MDHIRSEQIYEALDHDDFGLEQSKVINVIDSKELERVAGGKPLRAFSQPALVNEEALEQRPRRLAAAVNARSAILHWLYRGGSLETPAYSDFKMGCSRQSEVAAIVAALLSIRKA